MATLSNRVELSILYPETISADWNGHAVIRLSLREINFTVFEVVDAISQGLAMVIVFKLKDINVALKC